MVSSTSSSSPNAALKARGAGVTAVLGPTNTGKTFLAIERMVAHSSGVIGLPLRLLAREVYNKVVDKVGVEAVALITGEEKIKPPNPRFWVSTVEAMPRDLDVAFVALDEAQIGADLLADAAINLAREQAQRQADHARLVRHHALDREMRLAGIGGPEHGSHARAAHASVASYARRK